MGVEIFEYGASDIRGLVMPREGHGSRNAAGSTKKAVINVMPREGHGSRNGNTWYGTTPEESHAPRGAWE